MAVRLDRPVENANRDALPHPHSRTLHEVCMTKVELSLWIETNFPANSKSAAMRKPVYGVGVNDAGYMTKPMVGGKQVEDPAYSAWAGMMERAYSERCHKKHPTYVGVTVCKDWHSFRAFRTWWLANYRDGLQCDKDLLVADNREYSPWSCLYIPQWLNKFTTDSEASRGELPIGVCLRKQTGMYQSNCRNPITGKKHTLGYFTTPESAHEAWLKRKLELAAQLKQEMDAIDPRIYPNVVMIIMAAL